MRKTAAAKSNKQSLSQQILLQQSALQSLSAVASFAFSAYVSDGHVWIAVPEQCARALHDYGMGSVDGGPATAIQTAVKISQLVGAPSDEVRGIDHFSTDRTRYLLFSLSMDRRQMRWCHCILAQRKPFS